LTPSCKTHNSFADSKEGQSLGIGMARLVCSDGGVVAAERTSSSYETGEGKAGNWTANRRISLYCSAISCA
jgi:hypothetical protein